MEMLENNKINITQLQTEIRAAIQTHKFTAIESTSKRGSVITLNTDEASLEITIGPEWLGYELSIKKHVLGKEIGTFEDTDNYSLDYNVSVTIELFKEIIACLTAFLEGKLYVGRIDNKPTLAIPVDAKHYKIVKRGRIFGSKEVIENDKIQLSMLHPINRDLA